MAKVKEGDTVKVHYTGKDANGNVFDSSVEREPIEFTIGDGKIIPGFEQAVIGLQEGDTSTFTVEADDAYGQRRDDLLIDVEREKLPEDVSPEVGQQLQVQRQDGEAIPVVIAQVTDESVTLDANHPLAGEDLTFEVELVEVQG